MKVWNGFLIDGHNRFKISEEWDLNYEVCEIERPNRDAIKAWIAKNQLGRRNISDLERIRLARIARPEIEKDAEKRTADGNSRGGKSLKKSPETSQRNSKEERVNTTIYKLAKAAGMGEQKFRQGEVILNSGNKELIEQVKSGEKSIKKAYDEIKDATNKPHVANNSNDNEWYTPSEYIESARSVMGSIDLDPASNDFANKTVKAEKYYTKTDDGTKREWFGNIWLNPPYETALIQAFADKLANSDFEQAVVLVNNATETKWFATLVQNASAIVFPTGRIKYNKRDGQHGSPLQGQAFLYFGDFPTEFLDVFGKYGWGAIL